MNAYTRDLQVVVLPRFTADTTFEFETCYVSSQSPRPAPLLFSRGGSGNERVTEDCAKVMLVLDRSFAGQGHVTMSIIKIGRCTKWLQKLKEHDEISKTANFETAVAQAYAWDFMVVLSKCEKFKGFVWLGGKACYPAILYHHLFLWLTWSRDPVLKRAYCVLALGCTLRSQGP